MLSTNVCPKKQQICDASHPSADQFKKDLPKADILLAMKILKLASQAGSFCYVLGQTLISEIR